MPEFGFSLICIFLRFNPYIGKYGSKKRQYCSISYTEMLLPVGFVETKRKKFLSNIPEVLFKE